uniref:WD repeat-containing protein 19 n=2 Tax=Timema TaxID=61471 RepID=A0A7R9DXF6_9NEOP|nr:unnamed protein product [Timema monikensis]
MPKIQQLREVTAMTERLNWTRMLVQEVFKLDQPHGLGDVYITWQNGSGSFLATTGADKVVAIFNRNGKKIEQIGLSGMCTGFGWDADGDLLAIIMNDYHHVVLWDANTGKSKQVDTGLRDTMSCVVWAKRGPILAIGTARGNLTIYNHNTAKRVPILGKHSKRVTCGAWSAENLLALGSEDKTLSISNVEGDTLRVISMRSDPSDIQFSEMKLDERMAGENTFVQHVNLQVSVLVGRKTLFLYNLHDPDNPVELAFQQRFGDGYILVGFSAGYFVAISTHIKEVGQELFQVKNHKDVLTDIAICDKLGKVASCGDNWSRKEILQHSTITPPISPPTLEHHKLPFTPHQLRESHSQVNLCLTMASNKRKCVSLSVVEKLKLIEQMPNCAKCVVKIHDMSNLSETSSVISLEQENGIEHLSWSKDGQLLALTTRGGSVHVFLSRLPMVHSVYASHLAILTSLTEISIYAYDVDSKNKPALSATAELPVEPSWLSLGPYHCAAGLNNRAWFYELGSTDTVLILKEREYLGTVTSVKLSAEYASVLHEGKIQLHMVASSEGRAEVRPPVPCTLIECSPAGSVAYRHDPVSVRAGVYQDGVYQGSTRCDNCVEYRLGATSRPINDAWTTVSRTHTSNAAVQQAPRHVGKILGMSEQGCTRVVPGAESTEGTALVPRVDKRCSSSSPYFYVELSETALSLQVTPHGVSRDWMKRRARPSSGIHLILYRLTGLGVEPIEPANGDNEDKETRLFPDEHSPNIKLTSHALTTDFLIFASDMGHIQYFFIEDWKIISEYRHTVGIRSVHADQSGARLIVVDDKSEGYIYNPVTDELLRIPEFPPNSTDVLWDSLAQDRNVFVAFDNSTIVTYIHVKDSISGSMVEVVGTTKLPSNQVPLLLSGGLVLLETSSGKLTQLVLSTHEVTSSNIHDSHKDSLEQALAKQLVLRRFGEAWKTCQVLNTKEFWSRLAEATLKNLEIELGKSDNYYTSYYSVYRHLGDVGMVWLLQDIQHVEDQKLLNGHVAMFLQDFEKAQEWYLMSSRPVAALDMRRDLLQWDQALQLASKLAPDQIPYIACEYAQQLEFMGSYSEALSHYEQGLLSVREGKPGSMEETHTIQCRAGVARTSIRCGDIRRGVTMAADASSSRTLKKECGDILEGMKQLNDAAMLYEKGQYFDKAASTYIRLKNWVKVGELLHNITSSKIHLQYAKAKEADGKYQEAAEAYMTARDFDSVIRVNLDHLNNPEEAVQIVKDTKSTEGAKMVARYIMLPVPSPAGFTTVPEFSLPSPPSAQQRFFQRLNDYSSAIKFLVLSRCHDEAFQLARQHGQMELYGEILASSLDSEVRPDDFRSLALHFDSERKSLLAGKYYFHAGEYQKALKNLMNVVKANSEDTEAISLAIDVVGAANDDLLANQLIEFLLGESDNIPKDPKFLFRLYMARRQYREAAKTAIIIANEEQINGSYRNAHDVLFGMYQELRRNNIKIPTEMQANLTLLHSYILVRLHVRRGEHLKGARMLIRVADNISKFPSHIVPILTSTVIECSRAGLKSSAFSYAAMLMRPEYRPHIDPKYAKKIEAVVRKPSRGSQEEVEPETPCPYCDSPLPESELNCGQCKTTVPFCLVTVSLVEPSPVAGRHIVKDDLTACPNCDFPAIFSELRIILESEDVCPMCSGTIPLNSVSLVEDTRTYLHPQGND